ncbi:P-loop containing nucleoside triphosphate hydrolase protein, partial [Lyophyllum atratum]
MDPGVGNPAELQQLIVAAIQHAFSQLRLTTAADIHDAVAEAVIQVLPHLPAASAVSSRPSSQRSAEHLLRQFFPDSPSPKFKSTQQQEMVELAVSRERNFVAVLPTGGGKSLVWMLPALQERGFLTFVVSPNKALLADQLRRTDKEGIPCMQWCSGDTLSPEARIVYLALETAASKAFNVLLHENSHRALRIVIDEAHQMLTDTVLRPHFLNLDKFADIQIQKIYLTATLPPSFEPRLLQQAGLKPTTTIVRAATHQPQIRYHGLHVDTAKTTAFDFVVELAKLLTEEFLGPSRRGIIFCTSKADTERVSEAFTACHSHSGMGPDKEVHEKLWLKGDRQWIAATTGMIHGIDHPHVGAVIFFHMPYGLINIVQGAGRSGRDGTPSVVFCVDVLGVRIQNSPSDGEDDQQCRSEGLEYVQNFTECRRALISQTLDGRSTVCSDLPGCQRCDIC